MTKEIDQMRRCDQLRQIPAEAAIGCCMAIVEAMGADVRLTQAVTMLVLARKLVADFHDGVPPEAFKIEFTP